MEDKNGDRLQKTVTHVIRQRYLLDKDMMKTDLQAAAGLTHYTIDKLSRDEDVTTETLRRICAALNCTFDDIIEIAEDKKEYTGTEKNDENK